MLPASAAAAVLCAALPCSIIPLRVLSSWAAVGRSDGSSDRHCMIRSQTSWGRGRGGHGVAAPQQGQQQQQEEGTQ